MCTLSFLPVENGYVAAMNRDELRTRPPALPPTIYTASELSVVYPREPSGGTWIGANSRGTLLALLNWYSMQAGKLPEKSRSRGEIVPLALQSPDAPGTDNKLRRLNLAGIYPFRLFGFFPNEKQIREWCWDTRNLTGKSHLWGRRHWFSSSWSDELAGEQRGMACAEAWKGDPVDKSAWLRKLHATHVPAPGPFSICVHREDAATLSYTEVKWEHGELQMRYQPGNPCQALGLPVWSLGAPLSFNGPELSNSS